uniref:Torsin n=2 Tax=Danio rerio TaxID=7955 RepID=E7FDJ9_DANRE|eukprot:XP_684868.5 torsin-1A-like isoform X1 [Danio rerio]
MYAVCHVSLLLKECTLPETKHKKKPESFALTMKVQRILTALLLVSNITSSSCFLEAFTDALKHSAVYKFFERDDLLVFDPKRLEKDLNDFLFGQHIASNVILKSVSSFMTDSKPNKPLVLSLHGTTGTGKNHVTKILARNIYKKGEESKHVQIYVSEYNFPDRGKVDLYTAQLRQWIYGNVSSFPRSMFIFDEMDKMQPQLIDVLKPFLDYSLVNGVSFHNAIFIFLSNAGGKVIADLALDFWREGKNREDLWMNSRELEIKISTNVYNDKNCGFLHTSIIDEHLIDHFIPFLPLELKHVRQCVLAEMKHLNITKDDELADEVARDMPYFPEEERIFAVKGCKSVRQKLVLHVDE